MDPAASYVEYDFLRGNVEFIHGQQSGHFVRGQLQKLVVPDDVDKVVLRANGLSGLQTEWSAAQIFRQGRQNELESFWAHCNEKVIQTQHTERNYEQEYPSGG